MTKKRERYICRGCEEAFVPRGRQAYCSDRCAIFSRLRSCVPGECWEWTGATNDAGYGQLTLRQARVYTHRLAYELTVGPADGVLLHTCDNPPCCNPAHLVLGSQADNMEDMHRKGRWTPNPARGANAGGAKLSEDDVREVRRAVAAGEGIRPTARRFGVSQGAIHGIVRGRTWRHVS